MWTPVSQMSSVSFAFVPDITHHEARGISVQLCGCRQKCCARAPRLRADFEANSIACSPLLCGIMRLEHRHLVLLIKVSNQMEVIRRQIPPALTVMESVITVFVIIVFLIANDAGVCLRRPL